MESSHTQLVKFDSSEIKVVRRLTSGTSGQIWLAERDESRELRVLKVLRKDEDYDDTARQTWARNFSTSRKQADFVLGLVDCFSTDQSVVLVTEYMPRGDLESYIWQNGKLDVVEAQFYAAELCHALQFVHRCGVIHRNLGLEHLLLTASGHIRLTGFGTCKGGMSQASRTTTFCGSGLSLAPEVLLDLPYGRAVDWWGFGVLLFEMLEAAPPFRGEDEDMIFDEILDGDKPEYPPEMPESSKSILRQLLIRDPDARLGADQTDAEAVMAHPFFAGIVWEDIACERTLPPRLSYHHEAKEPITESSAVSGTGLSYGTRDELSLFGDF